MIWTIIGLVLLFWLLGFLFHVGEGFIHILLALALIIFIFDFLQRRRV